METLKRWASYLLLYLLILVSSVFYVALFAVAGIKRAIYKPVICKDRNEEPSCLKDPELGTHGFVELKNRDGRKIHYVANGSKEKPLMLFLHGFPEFWYSWRYQLKEFGKDYYAVAIDLTGYGDSSKPSNVTKYATHEIAIDVKETILELNFRSCILVGHDLGGSITYEVTTEFPEVVDKMIVLNCPHRRGFIQYIKSSTKQWLKSSYMLFFQMPYIPEYLLSAGDYAALESPFKDTTKEELEAYKYNFQKGGLTGPLNYYRMWIVDVVSPKRPIKRNQIRQPSLIVWGTADTVLPVELAEMSLTYMDNGTVKYVDGASHSVHHHYPEPVNEYVRKFLKEY